MSHWAALVRPSEVMPPALRESVAQRNAIEDEPKVTVRKAQPKRRNPPIPMDDYLDTRFKKSLKFAMLKLLVEGAMDRKAFREVAEMERERRGSPDRFAVIHAFDSLVSEGLIACEVKLTTKGYEKLRLRRPS